MVQGVKSKYFSSYWDTMFMSALIYPTKIDNNNKAHLETQKHFKQFYGSFKYVLGCRFCREYIINVLEPELPLDFSGKIPLMRSLYNWKNAVNLKLIKQNCPFTKPSPKFSVILKKYEKLRARCDAKVGKCV
jgi:hypothetical protein